MYKFKNTIKQRFSKERDEHHNKKQKTSDSNLRFNVKQGSVYSMESFENGSSSGFNPRKKEIKQEAQSVAVFALHANKSFYVPLSLDSHLLTDFVPVLGLNENHEENSKAVLHPVTISVNFQPHVTVKTDSKTRNYSDVESPENAQCRF